MQKTQKITQTFCEVLNTWEVIFLSLSSSFFANGFLNLCFTRRFYHISHSQRAVAVQKARRQAGTRRSAPDTPQSSQIGFMKAEIKSSSPPQEPHQYLDVKHKKVTDTFPASNENFHEMPSAEELMGRNIPFSYPKEEAWGTRDLLQGKRWRGHVTH